jgi:hypothetical protein
MKTTLKILAFLLIVCSSVQAQVAPAATGPRTLPVAGNLHYAFRYAQSDQLSNTFPDMQTASASGSLAYANNNQRKPFIMDYAGGYTWTIAGPSYATGLFQRMYLSQGIDWRRWFLTVHDDVSYLPQSPTTGFSGLPGTGEPIGVPNPNPNPSNSQSILTLNTHVVDNIAGGEIEHTLNFATTLTGGGSSELLRYPNSDGLNTNTQTGLAKLKWRLNGRNSVITNYVLSAYSYPDVHNVHFLTNTALVGFQHAWSRNLTTIASVGPQWVSSSDQATVPSSQDVSVSAAATYTRRFTSANVNYTRGTNGGAGYLLGGRVDVVQGNFTHQFGINSTLGMTGGYERTSGLSQNGVTNSRFGGAQFTRQIGRKFVVFASYTGIDQTSTSNLPTNALGQLLQVIGFGIGYSPRETHIRQ